MIDFEKIRQAAAEAIASAEITAISIAVVEKDRMTFAEGFGTTRLEHGTPVTASTLFDYASIAKVFCGILTMRLVENGLLDLDRPIIDYLDNFAFHNTDYGKRVTLRHLLSHTSGLPMGARSMGPTTLDGLARSVREEIPHYRFSAEPGRLTNYANTAFCIAGHVAEVVTGHSYPTLVYEQIFDPLGMHSCNYDLSNVIMQPVALPYHWNSHGERVLNKRLPNNLAGLPSGFYYGTAVDLAKMAVMLLNGGLLSATSIDEMMRAHGTTHFESATHYIQQQELSYGLGLKMGEYRGHRLVRHGGSIPGYQNFFQLFPDQERAVVILTTAVGENALLDLVSAVQDAVLELPPLTSHRMPPPAPAPLPITLDLPKLVGRYLNPRQATMPTVSLEGETLMLETFGRKFPLTYTASGEFTAPLTEQVVIPVRFLLGDAGRAEHVIIFTTPYQRNDESPPETIDLSRYEGCYQDRFNREPSEVLEVRVVDGVLHLGDIATELAPARPLGKHRFLTQIGLAEFEFSAENELIALQIAHAARYRPLKSQPRQRSHYK